MKFTLFAVLLQSVVTLSVQGGNGVVEFVEFVQLVVRVALQGGKVAF